MKKLFRKFTVLFLAIALIAMPTTTALAAGTPILIYSSSDGKMYEFPPSDNLLVSNSIAYLADVVSSTGLYWEIPAGKTFGIWLNYAPTGPIQVEVYQFGVGFIMTRYFNNSSFDLTVPPSSKTESYMVRVTNLSNNSIALYEYGTWYQ
ncbi:MAG: hypothetical protein K0R92_367 [Lachnospiraceae bacterium]|jgi:hypothetical protein|nr:hypothetical protein [Lachnospiraceae bacterium]